MAGPEERDGRGFGGSGEAQSQGQPRDPTITPMQPSLGPPKAVFGLDKFNGDNFAECSFKMENVFDHYDLLEVMEGTEKRPENDPEKSPWVRKSAQSYLLLGQALGSSQIRHIKPFQCEPEKGPKAWAALKGVHAPAKTAVAVVLERQMAALRIEEDEAVEEGVQKFFNLLTRLEGADLNYGELQKKTKLLALLPESWSLLIINLNRDLPRLSLEDVKRAILQEDFRRRELAGSDGAGAAKTGWGYGRGRGKGRGGGRFGGSNYNGGRGSGSYGNDNKNYGRGRGRGARVGRGRCRGGRGGRGGGAANMKNGDNESESRDDRFPGQFFFVSTQTPAAPEKDESFEEPAAVGKDEAMQEAERPMELLAQVNYVARVKQGGRLGKLRQSGGGGSSGWNPTKDADKKKNHSRKEKHSTKSSTSAKDAKKALCSVVGVVEPTVSLAPEAGKDFQAMAAAVQANPAVVLLHNGCSDHLMGTKEVFVDLQPSGNVKHVRGFNGAMQDFQGRSTVAMQGEAGRQVLIPNVRANLLLAGQLKENGVKLQEDGDGMLLVSAAGDVLGRTSYTRRVFCTEMRPCSAKSTMPTTEVVALRAIVLVTKLTPYRLHARLAHIGMNTIRSSAKHEVATGAGPQFGGSDANDVLAVVHVDLCGPFRVAAKDAKERLGPQRPGVVDAAAGDDAIPAADREEARLVTGPVTTLDVVFYKNMSLEVWKSEYGPASGWTPTTPPTDTSTATLPLLAEVGEPATEDIEDVPFPSPSPAPCDPPLVADLRELTSMSASGNEGRIGTSPSAPAKSIAAGRRDKQQVDVGVKSTLIGEEQAESAEEPTTGEKSGGKPAEVQQNDEGIEAGDDGGDAEESTDSDVVEVQHGPRQSGRVRRPSDFYVPAAFTTAYDEVDDDLQYDDAEEDEDFLELDPDMHANPEHRWDISTMTVKEALASWKGKAVKAAMEEEICSLVGMGTWELVERSPGVNIMKNRWVLTTKYHIDDTVEREKARLVVKGFTQVYGADYNETYVSVSSYVTLRIFLSIVTVLDLNLMQLDMKNAFLQSKLDRVDTALYFKVGDVKVTCWVLVYVDDLLAASSSTAMLKELKELLKAAFELREISPVQKYLGLKTVRDRSVRKLWLHQQSYADKLCRRFLDEEQNKRNPKMPVSVDAYATLTFNDEEAKERQEEEYGQKVGSLQFAATTTRPDIAFACSKLLSGLTVRSKPHWREVDRCLTYLANTHDNALEFGSGAESLKQSDTWTPATSRTGQARAATCLSLEGPPSLGQASASKFRQLDAGTPTVLWVYNKPAITVAEGMGLTGNLKHMERRQAWLQHMVKRGKFSLRYIPTAEQPADFLAETLHYPAFNRCSIAIDQVRLVDVGDDDNDVQQ
ncbi:unnamed protein product [Closterium sp. NIES-54]